MELLKYLPKNLLSYLVGLLVHLPLPRFIANPLIRLFGLHYKINFDEAEKNYTEYASIGDFFVRKLKPGVRPIGNSPVVHPADSVISQVGPIQNGTLIQAKGRTYQVQDLCKDPEALKKYDGGLFATYYLCPTDYHRVHSPVSGTIKSATHIPGQLWPVNSWSVNNIANLFPVNERVVVEIETEFGMVAVVFVGATNVGKMTMSFDSRIVTNDLRTTHTKKAIYDKGLPIQKGEELGTFHMGSTVVMLYPATVFHQKDNWDLWRDKKVKMGENFL